MEESKHLITIVPTQFAPIESGKYRIRLVSIEEDEGKFYQERFVLCFEIVEGKYAGSPCVCYANVNKSGNYGARNKLGKIISALGINIKSGSELDIYSLAGKECLVDIVLEKSLTSRKPINRMYNFRRLNDNT